MGVPPNQFRNRMSPSEDQNQQPSDQSYRDVNQNDENSGSNVDGVNQFGDQRRRSRYLPPWMVITEEFNDEYNLQFGYGFEPKKKKLEVQVIVDNRLQNSYVDIECPMSLKTGLGLSLGNGKMSNTAYCELFSLIDEEISRELRRQEAEIDRFFRVQGDRLRRSVLLNLHEQDMRIVSIVQNRVINKLQEKETELQIINLKNMVLEERLAQVNKKVEIAKLRVAYNDSIIDSHRNDLQNNQDQNDAHQEEFVDSEVDDTASFCNGEATELQLLPTENNIVIRDVAMCKACGVKEVCMVLIPCNHLCMCKECESNASHCPRCHSPKLRGLEVFL